MDRSKSLHKTLRPTCAPWRVTSLWFPRRVILLFCRDGHFHIFVTFLKKVQRDEADEVTGIVLVGNFDSSPQGLTSFFFLRLRIQFEA